jgi:hypothetical protein
MEPFNNPFRPGAGQPPPYLAGREKDRNEFRIILRQTPILKNIILTGLRGVGKTVLLETLKPIANENGWFWAGTDLSEASSVSEQSLVIRVLVDISALVSSFTLTQEERKTIGFQSKIEKREIKLTYQTLASIYSNTPGLESDKLKRVLEIVWDVIKTKVKGIVLAYDEAQILKDRATEKQYPLSLLLEVTQYLQKKQIPYLLVLTGLPTLFPNLVEARTYAERMFQIITLDRLKENECREAIIKPIEKELCPVSFDENGIREIIRLTNGYPYFIQFFCKEIYDMYLQQISVGIQHPVISTYDIIRKLDVDFYSGRWSRVTDRQRELLSVIAKLPTANEEFAVKDIAAKSLEMSPTRSFKPAYINNSLVKLIEAGLIYKNRRSKYSFAVPLLADYINRQEIEDDSPF